MRLDVLTREYPPTVYGGAGVHVAELVDVLRRHPDVDLGSGTPGPGATLDVRVRAFGEPRAEEGTTGYPDLAELASANATLRTLGVDLAMAADVAGADLLHSHTWYANMAGHVGGLLAGVPHVLSAHSLEPLRPWKAEQLGGGYAVSSWAESTAYHGAAAVIAVSAGMRADILRCYPAVDPAKVHVVHNGIDSSAWQPDDSPQAHAALRDLGIDPEAPSVVFVGRITRQKGLPYLLRAAARLPQDVQLVLCAGAPDTPEIAAEVEQLVAELATTRSGVVWIDRMLPRETLCQVLTAATVFVCPSIYEPLGIVNLEAMACGAAVVGTATGGIPEVVADGSTGWIVPLEQATDGTGTPTDPERFVSDLAQALELACSDRAEAARRGRAGRQRAVAEFSWETIAGRTVEVYEAALGL